MGEEHFANELGLSAHFQSTLENAHLPKKSVLVYHHEDDRNEIEEDDLEASISLGTASLTLEEHSKPRAVYVRRSMNSSCSSGEMLHGSSMALSQSRSCGPSDRDRDSNETLSELLSMASGSVRQLRCLPSPTSESRKRTFMRR